VKLPSFTPLQWCVHIGAWIPLAVLAYNAWSGNLTINPIQAAEQRTGDTAITFLILSLSCTPIYLLYGYRPVEKLRRPLGLYAFLYAAIHFSIFIWLDYGFDLSLLAEEFAQKPFILVGALTLVILTALAATSFDRSKIWLGKRWKKLHRLVYPASLLAVLHFAWASKGDIFGLSGDIIRPLLAGVLVVLLLCLRLPVVRRWILRRRQG
jgi:sulfoxide reductase heme-binding subunit YedZ